MARMIALRLLLIATVLTASTARADQPALRVEFVTAEEIPLRLHVSISGTIEARDSVDLGFRQAGRVVEVLVREGDHVTKGDVLAKLDSVQQDQALNVAEASLAAAQAGQEQARQASDRAAAMLARGVGTRAARDDALQALSQAEGLVESAQSSVEQASRAVEETQLIAPDDAVVTQRDVAPGQIVGAAQPVLSLAALDGLEAVFAVADQPMLDDAMGKTVALQTLNIDRPSMKGTVTEIAPLIDPDSGTVTVRARIEGLQGDTSLLGAAVNGSLEIEKRPQVAVPWTALMRDKATAAVWVVGEDRRVTISDVTIGSFSDRVVYLENGLEAGQTIVGAGSQLLYPGRLVEPAGEIR